MDAFHRWPPTTCRPRYPSKLVRGHERFVELWEDWMWEVLTWEDGVLRYRARCVSTLHRLQGRYIPCLLGVVRLCITPELTPLHPITDVVKVLALEYISGVSMEKLQPGINVSRTRGREDIQ